MLLRVYPSDNIENIDYAPMCYIALTYFECYSSVDHGAFWGLTAKQERIF